MKEYLSRLIEYQELMKEIEIAGEEHLKIIKQNPSSYLKKIEELRTRIASDVFLAAEDKEKMLKKISSYMEQLEQKKDELDMNSFLLGALLILLAKEGILQEVIEKVGEVFGSANSLYSQKDFENLVGQILRENE
ncbi:MAG: hypothetical protein QXR09_00730 [Candidatus Aenigmatarchaeota archaeon]